MEMIKEFKDTPFEKYEQTVLIEGEFFKVYPDMWPACDGHVLFVPKQNTPEFITRTLGEAILYGDKLVEEGTIDGYHFGMNMGVAAGQTVMWPHIHFLPRTTEDVEGFPGSIRLAHKGHRGFEYYAEHPELGPEYLRRHAHLLDEKGFIDG